MGLLVVIVGLAALCFLVVVVTRSQATGRVGRPSRRQIAVGVAFGAGLIAAGALLFPVVWWALFTHCCDP